MCFVSVRPGQKIVLVTTSSCKPRHHLRSMDSPPNQFNQFDRHLYPTVNQYTKLPHVCAIPSCLDHICSITTPPPLYTSPRYLVCLHISDSHVIDKFGPFSNSKPPTTIHTHGYAAILQHQTRHRIQQSHEKYSPRRMNTIHNGRPSVILLLAPTSHGS